jgi:hypothetical protein
MDASLDSLIPAKNSLFLKIFSLLIWVGNCAKSGCGAAVSCYEIGPGSPEIAKFPVDFPVSRELQVETGSYLTAHTTIQSFRTADFQADLKRAVSVGIFPGIVPLLRSPVTLAVSQADF